MIFAAGRTCASDQLAAWKGRADDELPAVTAPRQRMSADHVVNQRCAIADGPSGLEDYVCFSIRDEYSGVGVMCPRATRSQATGKASNGKPGEESRMEEAM